MPTSRKRKKHRNLLTIVGIGFIALSFTLLLAVFWPIVIEELRYHAKTVTAPPAEITPVDREFGIVIPKISANARVIPNVDPFDSRVYQRALTQGVAHAKGTGLPGQTGNIFLFSHSSVNFYEASRYNSVFYLLSKLEKNDEIILYYQQAKYRYIIRNTHIVSSDQIQYLTSQKNTVTLMTCWPPGTTYKRLLVIAERKE